MKFSYEHYEALKGCIAKIFNTVEKGDKSETRYLWDLFWQSKWSQTHREQYNQGDYTDAHIQTASKNIAKELSK